MKESLISNHEVDVPKKQEQDQIHELTDNESDSFDHFEDEITHYIVDEELESDLGQNIKIYESLSNDQNLICIFKSIINKWRWL